MLMIASNIRYLREKRGWTQAQVAEMMTVDPKTYQKWEVEKNHLSLVDAERLSKIFHVPLDSLTSHQLNPKPFVYVDTLPAEEFNENHLPEELMDSTDHEIFDAGLRKGAFLHHFNNVHGTPYSAIYIGWHEMLSCEREFEDGMIDHWNEMSD